MNRLFMPLLAQVISLAGWQKLKICLLLTKKDAAAWKASELLIMSLHL